MYDPVLSEQAVLDAVAEKARATFPDGFPFYTPDDTRAITAHLLQTAWDQEAQLPTRPLTKDETLFVEAVRARIVHDAPYYLECFVWIDEEGHGLRPLYPLWDSQRFTLERLAGLERKMIRDDTPDGILLNVLKVRQVGVSTLGMGLVSHRILTQGHIRALAGSDTEEQARYLFRMVERIYEQLPFFLKPAKGVPYSVGRELHLSNKSSLKTAWGKTTRGALQETGGKKGNIERGRTNSVVHISELATWDYPEQLDSSLLPGIPVNKKTLVLFESTAELAGDWWHRHWLATEEGEGRFHNLFIPWPVKYRLPAPADWSPNETTLKVAAQIERDSHLWVGETLHLTRDHLYWYESTRAYFAKKKQLHQFFKEYPSNPAECFMYAGRSVFSLEELESIDQAARKVIDIWAVEPSQEIAALRLLPEDGSEKEADLSAQLKAVGLRQDRRPAAPLSTRLSSAEAALHPVPPGFGFRRIVGDELAELSSLRRSVMTIYEYPRARGPRSYVLGVDVGDGLGQDYSAVTVIRVPTIEEPAEEVAQYVSNAVRPSQLAFIADAIGRFYLDPDGLEALAAIELNNHGITVQDLLQLHLGYTNFYVWEVVDAADPQARFTKRIGWSTTTRTRPILIEKFHDAVTTIDPITQLADFRLNSPITRGELRHFITEGLLGEAEHARGQYDDCIFSAAIGYYVAYRLAGGEAEPMAERRRRRASIIHRAQLSGQTRDWRNSAVTAEEADHADDPDSPDEHDEPAGLSFFADRARE